MIAHWTPRVDIEAKKLFSKLSLRELRFRQSICNSQIKKAYADKNERALIDLHKMENASRYIVDFALRHAIHFIEIVSHDYFYKLLKEAYRRNILCTTILDLAKEI